MMKNYEAPEAILVGFEASEALAAVIDFDDLIKLEGNGGVGDAVIPSGNDINIGT